MPTFDDGFSWEKQHCPFACPENIFAAVPEQAVDAIRSRRTRQGACLCVFIENAGIPCEWDVRLNCSLGTQSWQ
jgi:hypothetical protein